MMENNNGGAEGSQGGGGGIDGNNSDEEYQPPVIRTLHAPMGFRDALWSSSVPEETIQDISKLRNGVQETLMQATDPGMICMASMDKAESI